MTLLQQRDQKRRERRIQIHEETRNRLREALAELVPNRKVIVFGSLTKLGVFNDRSDVDLAVEDDSINTWKLASDLMARLERPVDVVALNRCRFRTKILREGEEWIT